MMRCTASTGLNSSPCTPAVSRMRFPALSPLRHDDGHVPVLAGAHLRTLEEKSVLLTEFEVMDVKLTDDGRALDRVTGANRAGSSGNAHRTGKKSAATGWDED